MEEILKRFLGTNITGEVYAAFIIIILMIIVCIIIFFKCKKAMKNPLKTPKGILFFAMWGVEKADNLAADIMGERNRKFGSYVCVIFPFVFFSFTFGLIGLPTPMTSLAVALTLSLYSFIMLHVTAIKYQKWSYFKRFIDPIPIFLPINLITMWAPLLSMALRMVGNAIAGFCLLGIVECGLQTIGTMIFGTNGLLANLTFIALDGIATPLLHAYFDVFSGFIQSFIFTMLTLINVYQEQPSDPENIVENVINQ